jgi:hypothetical protein
VALPKSNIADRLLARVTSFYLQSGHFNGMPVARAATSLRVSVEAIQKEAAQLIDKGLLSANFGDFHPNPHVKALDPPPPALQVARLGTAAPQHACVYPEPLHLKTIIDRAKYI